MFWSETVAMGCCGSRRMLMLVTTFCACFSLVALCLALVTDFWINMVERISVNEKTTPTFLNTSTGLWRSCRRGSGQSESLGNCSYIKYFQSIDKDGLGPTDAILITIRQATVFPLISLLILFSGAVVCFLGHCNHRRKVFTFVAGILFVIGGLVILVGLILFIGAITEEVGNLPKQSAMDDPRFLYSYGASFVLAVASFVCSELTGVLSVYLYISRHKHAYRQKQRERLSMIESNSCGADDGGGIERPRHSRDTSSRENSPCHSDTFYTYTPVSDSCKEMSSYTLNRDPSRHTISATGEQQNPHQHYQQHLQQQYQQHPQQYPQQQGSVHGTFVRENFRDPSKTRAPFLQDISRERELSRDMDLPREGKPLKEMEPSRERELSRDRELSRERDLSRARELSRRRSRDGDLCSELEPTRNCDFSRSQHDFSSVQISADFSKDHSRGRLETSNTSQYCRKREHDFLQSSMPLSSTCERQAVLKENSTDPGDQSGLPGRTDYWTSRSFASTFGQMSRPASLKDVDSYHRTTPV